MLTLRSVFTAISASLLVIACGGGADSETDSEGSSGTISKYAGKWKMKNFCLGPHPDKTGFYQGKYGASITDIQVSSNETMSIRHYALYFNNPMCSGNGETIPGESPTTYRLVCYRFRGTTEISGNRYEKFENCDRGGDRTIFRISNGELENSTGGRYADQNGFPSSYEDLNRVFSVKYQ